MCTRRRLIVGGCFAALAVGVGFFLFAHLWPGDVRYAWLDFGPEADVRVLVTVAGDTITLQPYDGGRPAGPAERFKDRGSPLEFALADPDGVTTYTIRKCGSPVAERGSKRGTPAELFVNVEVGGAVTYRQYCNVFPASDLGKAPLSHFHGPLAIVSDAAVLGGDSSLVFRRGDETDLRAVVGTEDAERGCWVVVKSHDRLKECLFPDGVRPVADIEFPPKVKGGPPVRRRFVLSQFC
jgi:hypothetical protein